MCGITAYVGNDNALPFLLQGLVKLEYRGYDSAGVTIIDSANNINTYKAKGRIKNLEELLEGNHVEGKIGIGHTRWATHGVPSNLNAHPHTNNTNTISIVHNGIIENYQVLKKDLIEKGYHFNSQTDSEVVVHLLDYYYHGDMHEALKKVISIIEGSYALCVVHNDNPNVIYITKKDSPIVLGRTQTASLAGSDIPAILDYAKDVYFMEDGEIAVLTKDDITFYDADDKLIQKELVHIPYDNEAAQKGGYDSFMLKEIHEQPYVIKETLRGRVENGDRVVLPELDAIHDKLPSYNKAYFVACGTAYHSSIFGASVLEKLAGIPTITQVASEFRYNDPIVDENTLAFFVSQSGETADTMAALRLAKQKGATTIAIVNVLGSSISREADHTIYTLAGPEIAVASTKAYTTQIVVMELVAMYIAQALNRNSYDYRKLIEGLSSLPAYLEEILKDEEIFKGYAKLLEHERDCYYIGRGLDYASVLEGALKVKEVSYIHADAYVAGELKHGPIALIEDGSIVIAVATQPNIASKTISNIQETIARGARVVLFTIEGMDVQGVENTYILPNVDQLLQGILVAVPLQLIAYYTAVFKNCDVDKPRNLAKSVTVE